MRPPIRVTSVTTATQIGPPNESWLLNLLEGIVTELDFNSAAIGAVLDTHYSAQGVTLESVDSFGVPMGSVFAATGPARPGPGGTIVSDPDPDDPRGPNSHTIGIFQNGKGGFNDTQGGVRATFQYPQQFVAIDARPVFYTGEHAEVEADSVPYLLIFGVPPKFTKPHQKQLPLAKINFPLATTDTNFESWQTISFLSTSANIGFIEFSCHYKGTNADVYSYFDLLRFAHHLPLSEIDEVG